MHYRNFNWNNILQEILYRRVVLTSIPTKKHIHLQNCPKYLKNGLPHVPVYANALKHGNRIAVCDEFGSHSYKSLVYKSAILADLIQTKKYIEPSQTVAFLTDNDSTYIVCTWAIWLCSAVAVPLCKLHPANEIEYVVQDSSAKLMLSSNHFSNISTNITSKQNIHHLTNVEHIVRQWDLEAESVYEKIISRHKKNFFSDALIIYTSGTTGKPKGVVWKHEALWSQVQNMLDSWKWTKDDSILHILPLHHVHGVVNALYCPLAIGARVDMLNKFDPKKVWNVFTSENPPSVFTAVPTVYAKLLQYYNSNLVNKQDEIEQCCKKVRLMISGSAGLPESIHKKWKDVTSHNLLERYGMTEIGMALTNPYNGSRKGGFVGMPFPNMEVKIVDEDNLSKTLVYANHDTVEEFSHNESGSLLVRGTIFDRYWNKPDATTESFTHDGWFLTGDTAVFEKGAFKILGRSSVDIIKSSGYKISALDIERELLEHPAISEITILGIDDDIAGQIVAALVVLEEELGDQELNLEKLQQWCKDRIAKYKIPQKLKIVHEIPKNAMGKINKKSLLQSINFR